MTTAAQSRGSSKGAPEMLPNPQCIYAFIDAAEMFKQQDIHWQQGQSAIAFKRLGSAEEAERGSCLQRAKETTISLGSALSHISGNSVAYSNTQSYNMALNVRHHIARVQSSKSLNTTLLKQCHCTAHEMREHSHS